LTYRVIDSNGTQSGGLLIMEDKNLLRKYCRVNKEAFLFYSVRYFFCYNRNIINKNIVLKIAAKAKINLELWFN